MKEYPACTHNLQPQFRCFATVESLYRFGDTVSDVENLLAARPSLDDNPLSTNDPSSPTEGARDQAIDDVLTSEVFKLHTVSEVVRYSIAQAMMAEGLSGSIRCKPE
jgi:hypothetical protein